MPTNDGVQLFRGPGAEGGAEISGRGAGQGRVRGSSKMPGAGDKRPRPEASDALACAVCFETATGSGATSALCLCVQAAVARMHAKAVLARTTPPLSAGARRAEASRESPPLLAHTVTQCANGHPFCGACVQGQTRCPKCRHPMDPANPIRCLVAEQVPARCCSFLRAGGPRTRAPQAARPLLVPVVANDWALCRAGASASAC